MNYTLLLKLALFSTLCQSAPTSFWEGPDAGEQKENPCDYLRNSKIYLPEMEHDPNFKLCLRPKPKPPVLILDPIPNPIPEPIPILPEDNTPSSNNQQSCIPSLKSLDCYVGKRIVKNKNFRLKDDNIILEKDLPKPYRIAKPNSMMTMDYNVNRLTLEVDENGIVKSAKMY